MIDPDGIQIQENNLPEIITIREVPEFETECYCLEDDKEYERFVIDVEKRVSRSFEYRRFIYYIRDNMNMNECAFLKGVTNKETFDIKIEIHHYPFSLRDVTEIVIRKRRYYGESMTLQMVSKEITELHYKLLIGLIPLSQTVHELAHSSRIFIPVDKVMGRYNLMVDIYKPFCDVEQLETLSRIEKYSEEKTNRVLDTNILAQNRITYDVKDENFILPDYGTINTAMIEQLKNIKENNYILPAVDDVKYIEETKPVRTVKIPVSFDNSIIVDHTVSKYSWE